MTAPSFTASLNQALGGGLRIQLADLSEMDGYAVFDRELGVLHVDQNVPDVWAAMLDALAEDDLAPVLEQHLAGYARPELSVVAGGGQSSPRRAALRMVQGTR